MDIGMILISMGITPSLKGFDYLISAVSIYKEKGFLNFSKFYKEIGEKTNTNKSQVERAVRYAMLQADHNSEAYKKYIIYKNTTVSEFISTLAYTINKEQEEDTIWT